MSVGTPGSINNNHALNAGLEAGAQAAMEDMQDLTEEREDFSLGDGAAEAASEEYSNDKKVRRKDGIKAKKSKRGAKFDENLKKRQKEDYFIDMSKKLAQKAEAAARELPTAFDETVKKSIEQEFNGLGLGEDVVHLSKPFEALSEDAQKIILEKEALKPDIGDVKEEILKQQKTLNKGMPTALKEAAKREQAKEKESPVAKKMAEYLKGTAEQLLKTSQKKQVEHTKMRQELIQSGVTPKRISTLEQTVSKYIKKDLKEKLKSSYFDLIMTMHTKKTSADKIMAYHKFSKMEDSFKSKGILNEDRNSSEGVKNDVKEDMRTFISYELDNVLRESQTKGESVKELIETFNKYNQMAGKVEFNEAEYMKTIGKKLEDWGLRHFKDPNPTGGNVDTETSPQGAGTNTGDGQSGQNSKNRNPFNIDIADEREDELRTLFMQRAISTNFTSKLEMSYKINRLSKAMKRDKVANDEQIERLGTQGVSLAIMRLLDLLKESLEEKATVSDTKSTEYKMVMDKYKRALKGLKRVDSAPGRNEIKLMQDEVNNGMFTLIKGEYAKVRVQLEALPNNVALMQREKNYIKILERLKKESKIKESITPTVGQTVVFDSNTNFIQAA